MKFLLPLLLAAAVLGVAASSAYLTPLYPVYAQNTAGSSNAISPARLKQIAKDKALNVMEATKEARMGDFKEKMASRAAELRKKLDKFKDQLKAQRVLKINENLNKINQSRSQAFLRHHTKLSGLLTKIEDRLNEASGQGKDMTEAKSALSHARTDLDKAKAAIDAQLAKDYTLEATSEAAIKTEAQAARNQLFSDLKAVHELIVSARKSLAEAVSTAVSSMGGVKNGQQ